MLSVVKVEIKKLMSSMVLWMIPAGAILPAIISVLVLLNIEGVYWKGYIHTSMDTFNPLAFLIFACFVSFIWAREYEEGMMEITLLYPYPKYVLLYAKIILMFIIIAIIVILWAVSTYIAGRIYLGEVMNTGDLKELIKMLPVIIVTQFLLVTITFFITMVFKNILVGAILGVISVVLCYLFQASPAIQYIPICLPMVLSHNLYGFNQVILDSYAVSFGILSATFTVMLIACVIYLRKKWELH
ncbi:MAG: ABC transporter permease [Lachnospiraceae bacterium]|nr:ABC transporter permease [Lachnospiraceae bacterium]